jgi:hypothetical protein
VIINWGALALVACATVVVAISIVGLFTLGVAALTAGTDKSAAAPARGESVDAASMSRRPGLDVSFSAVHLI